MDSKVGRESGYILLRMLARAAYCVFTGGAKRHSLFLDMRVVALSFLRELRRQEQGRGARKDTLAELDIQMNNLNSGYDT